ncbi:MAG: aryldialkylphosphatase [Microbacteriaceae bacterium]|jgi:predicted metal-dependent phosphotriesterase family hydrolase|nr:aryldialkylphosphatase [Microbacteriaceae bacterium]
MSARGAAGGFIRTITGDITDLVSGAVYMHEHLIIDSALIAASFAHIHLNDVDAAVEEATLSRQAGAALFVDAMPASSGRDIARLVTISQRSDLAVVATTGLHHDRYYGPLHWTNRVDADDLTALFIADLSEGVDEFDYTGPIIRRSTSRAGLVKAATSGEVPDARDRRNLEAAGHASAATGAPVLTHCEGGWGGFAQVEALVACGVPAASIILSHVDKTEDLGYLLELAGTGVFLELDQTLRQHERATSSISVRAVVALVEAGYGAQIVVGTDGARRSLWTSLGGTPGLAWLAAEFPALLRSAGLTEQQVTAVMRENALRALRWRQGEGASSRSSS